MSSSLVSVGALAAEIFVDGGMLSEYGPSSHFCPGPHNLILHTQTQRYINPNLDNVALQFSLAEVVYKVAWASSGPGVGLIGYQSPPPPPVFGQYCGSVNDVVGRQSLLHGVPGPQIV